MKTLWGQVFDVCIKRSWWVILFFVSCFGVYDQAVKKKMHTICALEYRFSEYVKERALSHNEKEDLTLRIHSHSDPVWIEMVLMRKLGVVPEGFMKVHFVKE